MPHNPMKWESLLSRKRLGRETEALVVPGGRSAFDSDVDRIIFSGAFRRLSRKTQVHPLAANDHVHTRLTHSLEVARVGNALGKELGSRIRTELPAGISPSDLGVVVHAACLAHDLGNPPFGHAGEEAMAHWFEVNGPRLFGSLSKDYKHDLISFEGNAQGFRVLTQTENHLFKGGLQLTYATLGTFLKYPWSSRKAVKKFGAFLTEEGILNQVAEDLGLLNKGRNQWSRHPLAHLVEAADDICYGIIDLEDAVELQILPYQEVEELLLSNFSPDERARIKQSLGPKESHRVNLARLRGPIFDSVVAGAIDGFMNGYERIMNGQFDSEVFELLEVTDPRRSLISRAKKLSAEKVFQDQKKVEIEIGSYATFECLLESFCRAALDRAQHLRSPKGEVSLGWKSNLVLKLLTDHAPSDDNAPPGTSWSSYQCLRRVIDFVSGMTDNYAIYIAKQLQGMGFSGGQRP